jgi:protein translocase SecG subunit
MKYIIIVLAILLMVSILLQRTGAELGGAFGGQDNFGTTHHTRRGLEKGLFVATIIIAVLFAITAILSLI